MGDEINFNISNCIALKLTPTIVHKNKKTYKRLGCVLYISFKFHLFFFF